MIKRKDYEIIKSFIHMSIVPMSVKKLWLRDKKFKGKFIIPLPEPRIVD